MLQYHYAIVRIALVECFCFDLDESTLIRDEDWEGGSIKVGEYMCVPS